MCVVCMRARMEGGGCGAVNGEEGEGQQGGGGCSVEVGRRFRESERVLGNELVGRKIVREKTPPS